METITKQLVNTRYLLNIRTPRETDFPVELMFSSLTASLPKLESSKSPDQT